MTGRGRAVRRLPLSLVAPLVALAVPAQAAAAVRKGDWEAAGPGGAKASFAVATALQRVHGATRRSMVVEDLVVDAPIRCVNPAGSPAPYDLEVVLGPLLVSPRGRFSSGRLRRGSGTIVRARLLHGRFEIGYRHVSRTRNPFDGGAEVCDTGRIHLVAVPAHRRAIKDGVWTGSTQNNEPVELNVVAGGRALATATVSSGTVYAFEVRPESQQDDCPGLTSTGSTDSGGYEAGAGPGAAFRVIGGLFINPDGTFDNSQYRNGDSQVVTGRFSGHRSVDGQFTNPGQGCSWSWSARPG